MRLIGASIVLDVPRHHRERASSSCPPACAHGVRDRGAGHRHRAPRSRGRLHSVGLTLASAHHHRLWRDRVALPLRASDRGSDAHRVAAQSLGRAPWWRSAPRSAWGLGQPDRGRVRQRVDRERSGPVRGRGRTSVGRSSDGNQSLWIGLLARASSESFTQVATPAWGGTRRELARQISSRIWGVVPTRGGSLNTAAGSGTPRARGSRGGAIGVSLGRARDGGSGRAGSPRRSQLQDAAASSAGSRDGARNVSSAAGDGSVLSVFTFASVASFDRR